MPAARPTRAAFPWGRLALYGAVHGALGALFLLAGPYAATAFPLDDAYIHHVYAEGVAFGEGFAYNPGAPANGATSPLWVLLLAPLRLLGLRGAALVLPTKLLGLALGALLALVADHLAAALGASPKARFAAGLLVAANPLVVYGAVSGMELPLASLLLLAALLALARRRLLAAGLALGAGILARPELTLAWLFVAGLEGRRRRAPPPTALWLPGALVWAVWMGRSLHVADAWLPTTFAAKHDAAGLAQWVDVPWAALIALGGPLAIVTLPLGVLAIRRWWRRP
ncbi:MAG TPA: hypothetical protein RMI62_21860, partial [Polyangiaceae bacterium LLY-WYZ-15_(1-7)]|nr:hypothetical protein [Polyangiaceae bacterium LLY-WYZ-15_(1-7)]